MFSQGQDAPHGGRGEDEEASFSALSLFFVYVLQMHGALYVVGREEGREEETCHSGLGGK